jgi:GTPase SAR1 family protein
MSQQQEPSAGMRDAAANLDLAIKGARAYGREDLVQRLTGARQLLSDPSVIVYVVGEFKQGKSSLINALLTAPVCPVDDDIATAVPTEVQFAQQPAASAHYESTDDWSGPRVETIPVSNISAYVSDAGNPGNEKRLRSVTVGINHQMLSGGLVLVDTPGVGGLGSVYNAVTVRSLPQAHAVLFVSDASQELTGPELKFLRIAEELCPVIYLVMTKIDLYPQWREILQLDVQHLRESGSRAVRPLPVSSMLRSQAAQWGDQQLNDESGFPGLISSLQYVVGDAERVAVASVAHHVLAAVSQLDATLRSRKSALDHPERSEQLLNELTQARERADRLRSQSARWQTVMFDGFADISSDVDYDLRSRIRLLLADGEKAIDEGDPGKNWDEFEAWLRQRLAAETLENYALLVRLAKEVATRVADHFDLAESEIAPPEVTAPVTVTETIETDSSFATGDKRLKAGLAGLQKGYFGFIMISMTAGLTSLAIPVAPVGLAAAALLGRTGFKEDRLRQLEKRRTQAKLTVRRFIDEFNMQVGKDSRDVLRRLQREMRDGYTQRAEELQRSMSEALSAAQQAVNAAETDSQEIERMNADLRSLEMVRSGAAALLARTDPTRREHVAAAGAPG